MLTIRTDPITAAVFKALIEAARKRNITGLAHGNDYALGQADLIIDMCDLSALKCRDYLVLAITEALPVATVITRS